METEKLGVFLERRASKTYVGKLFLKEKQYVFEYDKTYAYAENSIPIGPDLPITKRLHKSEKLFASFADRIPSKRNPAYIEYCQKFGISPDEKDEIILLSTIGKRGPSSFVFEILNDAQYSATDYIKFRTDLNLTIRDFSAVFDIGISTLQKLEKNSSQVKESLKRIEIYDRYPEVALFELGRNGKLIHSAKKEITENILKEKIRFNKKKRSRIENKNDDLFNFDS
jgi:HipA-like protein